jgi:hypothetical protein
MGVRWVGLQRGGGVKHTGTDSGEKCKQVCGWDPQDPQAEGLHVHINMTVGNAPRLLTAGPSQPSQQHLGYFEATCSSLSSE